MSIQKFKGVITALSISLILGITAPQAAIADNLPADSTYSESINNFYNLVVVTEGQNFAKIVANPAGNSVRTTTKYKNWLKQVNASQGKISSALSKLSTLTAGPSYSKSDLLLKTYVTDYASYLKMNKAVLAKKKPSKADIKSLTTISEKVSQEATDWISLYSDDFAASNFSAPTTSPSATFTAANDSAGGKTLTATLANNSSFDQKAFRITSYDIEWYVGSTTSTAIPNSVVLSSIDDTVTLDLTGTVVGGLYFFRVKAVNSVGKGPWSTFFQVTVGA
jgi:hypothetical protein